MLAFLYKIDLQEYFPALICLSTDEFCQLFSLGGNFYVDSDSWFKTNKQTGMGGGRGGPGGGLNQREGQRGNSSQDGLKNTNMSECISSL